MTCAIRRVLVNGRIVVDASTVRYVSEKVFAYLGYEHVGFGSIMIGYKNRQFSF